MAGDVVAPPRGERGLKFRCDVHYVGRALVAPPRGERGLKFAKGVTEGKSTYGRSPSWGAWIEIYSCGFIGDVKIGSLPLVGSVD